MSTTLFYCILVILILQYCVDTVLDYLNARRFSNTIPEELDDVFDANEYQKAQQYHRENYRFGTIKDGFSLAITLLFLILGGFGWVDNYIISITENPVIRALIFFGILVFGSSCIALPFSYYRTFVIEEKYGFNKTSKTTFFTDLIKGGFLTALLGGGILALIIWFLQQTGNSFWWYAWITFAVLTIGINLFYTKLFVPLFNKQTPLSEGSLKAAITAYATGVGFDLKKIFVIDGSKRSTKANAYFSGFGAQKQVTLFDTLINDLNEREIVAVLAHEVGHYKRKHIIANLALSILFTGLTLYILSLFISNAQLSLAIGVNAPSYHAALLAFFLLYSPISTITGLIMNHLSRKFEFQADDYARETHSAAALISSLKKLSKNNLSNLTPHPAYVFVHYSHPPLLERIQNLKA
ncbi:MAG: M48 family metallopeptidase [Bacteroidota bacterium]